VSHGRGLEAPRPFSRLREKVAGEARRMRGRAVGVLFLLNYAYQRRNYTCVLQSAATFSCERGSARAPMARKT
jgi:hypothetical protein